MVDRGNPQPDHDDDDLLGQLDEFLDDMEVVDESPVDARSSEPAAGVPGSDPDFLPEDWVVPSSEPPTEGLETVGDWDDLPTDTDSADDVPTLSTVPLPIDEMHDVDTFAVDDPESASIETSVAKHRSEDPLVSSPVAAAAVEDGVRKPFDLVSPSRKGEAAPTQGGARKRSFGKDIAKVIIGLLIGAWLLQSAAWWGFNADPLGVAKRVPRGMMWILPDKIKYDLLASYPRQQSTLAQDSSPDTLPDDQASDEEGPTEGETAPVEEMERPVPSSGVPDSDPMFSDDPSHDDGDTGKSTESALDADTRTAETTGPDADRSSDLTDQFDLGDDLAVEEIHGQTPYESLDFADLDEKSDDKPSELPDDDPLLALEREGDILGDTMLDDLLTLDEAPADASAVDLDVEHSSTEGALDTEFEFEPMPSSDSIASEAAPAEDSNENPSFDDMDFEVEADQPVEKTLVEEFADPQAPDVVPESVPTDSLMNDSDEFAHGPPTEPKVRDDDLARAKPSVGPIDAPVFERDDVIRAVTAARNADEALTQARANRSSELVSRAEAFYRAFADLAEKATFWRSPSTDEVREGVRDLVRAFEFDEKKQRMIANATRNWIKADLGKGVFAAVNVDEIVNKGAYFEIRSTLMGKEATPISLLTQIDPAVLGKSRFGVGDRVLLLGVLIRHPERNIDGYTGASDSVVWFTDIVAPIP